MQIYVKSKDCSTESCTFVQGGGKQVDLTGNFQAEFLRPVYKKKKKENKTQRKKKQLLAAGADRGDSSWHLFFPCARNRNVINMELLENWSIS